jgi:hypothetical protein
MEQNTGIKIRPAEMMVTAEKTVEKTVEKAVERTLISEETPQTAAHSLGYIGATPDFMVGGQHYNIDNLTPELVTLLREKYPTQTKGLFKDEDK